MRPFSGISPDSESPFLSTHDKKIKERVDKFMTTTEDLYKRNDQLRLCALAFVTDPFSSHAKPTKRHERAFEEFCKQFNNAVKKSNKEKNQLEFISLVQDALAERVIPEVHEEYLELKGNKTSNTELCDWIIEQHKKHSSPTIQSKAILEPEVSSSKSSSSETEADVPSPFGLPGGTKAVIELVSPIYQGAYSNAPFPPSSAQSAEASNPNYTILPQAQAQPQPGLTSSYPKVQANYWPQPQPALSSSYPPVQPGQWPQPDLSGVSSFQVPVMPYPATPSASSHASQDVRTDRSQQLAPTQLSGPANRIEAAPLASKTVASSGALPVRPTFTMLGLSAEIDEIRVTSGLSRDDFVLMLRYLVAGETPEVKAIGDQRVAEQFQSNVQLICSKRDTVDVALHRLWDDTLAVFIVASTYNLDLAENLEKQLREGVDRNQIANWFNQALPR